MQMRNEIESRKKLKIKSFDFHHILLPKYIDLCKTISYAKQFPMQNNFGFMLQKFNIHTLYIRIQFIKITRLRLRIFHEFFKNHTDARSTRPLWFHCFDKMRTYFETIIKELFTNYIRLKMSKF